MTTKRSLLTAMRRSAWIAVLAIASGCGDDGSMEPRDDGGPELEVDAGPGAGCEEVTPAVMIFATSCAASGACHVEGGQYPDLSRGALADLAGAPSRGMPGETLVVPGDPERSWLYRKVSAMQGPSGG